MTAKKTEPQPTKPKAQPQQQTTPLAPASVVLTLAPTGEVEPDNPEYAVTKGIIQKLAKEIVVSRMKLKT